MAQIADALLAPGRDGAYDAVLKWVLLMALIVIGAVVSYDYGLLTYLFEADRSRITALIAVLFVGFSGHCLWILVELAREYRRALQIKAILATATRLPALPQGGGMIDGFVADVIRSRLHPTDGEGDAHLLMMSLGASFRRRTKIGTYGTDLLYKLGMLGTMVGFVMMLNSMGDLANFDVDTLRGALQDMIAGMAVSLLTTIAGLIGGILLRLEYNIADALVTDISQTAVSLTEVSLLPLLAGATAMFEEEQEPEFEIFSSLLFNSLKAITFMFFISFAMINKPADSGKVDPKAEMLITVTWPDSNPDDVDSYVEDPAGNVVWYNQREAGLMHLDRDDRGMFKDVILFNDKEIENPLNQEIISFRGLEDGEYVVNIVHYIANGTAPLPVKVKVEKLNPSVKVVYYETLELNGAGEERTAVRFTLKGAEVINVGNAPKSLVELTRAAGGKDGSARAAAPAGPMDAGTGQALGANGGGP